MFRCHWSGYGLRAWNSLGLIPVVTVFLNFLISKFNFENFVSSVPQDHPCVLVSHLYWPLGIASRKQFGGMGKPKWRKSSGGSAPSSRREPKASSPSLANIVTVESTLEKVSGINRICLFGGKKAGYTLTDSHVH
jgi:hypothetical protein